MNRLPIVMLIFIFCLSVIVCAQELEIPGANTNIKGKVKLDTVKQAVLSHSKILWGSVTIGPAIPQCDLEGNILAYEICFSTRHAEFPSYGEMLGSIKRGRRLVAEGYTSGNERLYDRGRMLAWGVTTYRTIIISARYDMYPIPEYSTGLSPFYTTGDLAKQKAAELLGTVDITLTRMYYGGHLSRWFEFTAQNGRKILIDVFSLVPHQPGTILIKRPKQNAEDIAYIKANNRQAWEKVKSGVRLIKRAAASRTISNVPFYDWSFGCSPTASAMILGYYDERGYSKLIDYYIDRYDPVEEEWDYNIPNAQRELAQAMKTRLATGSTYIIDIAPGNTHVTNNINGYRFESNRSDWGTWSNNFNWNSIKREIDAGRPFHWVVIDYYSRSHGEHIDHSVAAVGYTNDYYVVVHNTWDTREHNWYYYNNVGGLLSISFVINIVPIGNKPPFLNAIGNQSVREGGTLQFTISGRDPDNDPITFSAQNLPAGATFNPAARSFSWVPNYTQSGTYTVRFKVSDAEFSDFEDVEITVVNVKRLIPKP